ncbi:MAG: sugar transferase [Planctomycetota bacterium]|nr:MAG: sugar transferase [Planctomycetota bacterium]REJ88451.1 MAG: sugar transferase [Planctomycetota bacterium]REK22353.1 MAG: sugar transferase [Planctomycetota bacterium]REK43600.1 MAG: sugar transferase [Planctomycetota bacterium]
MQPALIEDGLSAAGNAEAATRDREVIDYNALGSSRYLDWTAWLNQVVGFLLLIPMSIPIAIVSLMVKLSSPGPIIYRQTRVGRHGKVFTLYKVRTMCQNAESKTGPVWTATNDSRITPVGRILRKLHLDELPQLLNVVRGDMVLIGPRPERPEFTHYLAQAVPGYINRLAAKPGITGVAQILLPPDSDLEGVRLKLAADLKYIRTAGVWMDVRVMTCTFLRMFRISGPRVARFFGFDLSWIDGPLAEIRELGDKTRIGPIDSSNVPATFAVAMANQQTADESTAAATNGQLTSAAEAETSQSEEAVPSVNPGLPR